MAHGPQGQKALRQMEKEAQQEIEDPDRYFADEDEMTALPRKGRGRGRSRGRGRGARGRGKRVDTSAAATSAPSVTPKPTGQPEVVEDDDEGGKHDDGEMEPGVEPVSKKPKKSVIPKAKTSKRRGILKRANSKSPGKMDLKPSPAKEQKKGNQDEKDEDCVDYKSSQIR